MDLIYDIKVDSGARYLARSPKNLNLKVKDWCVIRKDKILDYGRIVRVLDEDHRPNTNIADLPRIERKATVLDQSKANENHMRAKSAFRTGIQHIEKLNLPMKLLNCHYSYDGKLVTFQFTADGRVDFRELVKNLSHALNTRIELRQIGVRDETALCGGIGTCGQELCCSRFLRDFASINVKMAKEQDISLNPTNISGCCGRLKCCLKYEHEGYLELDQNMPRRGADCECPEGRGKIIDRNLLTRTVTVQVEGMEKPIVCSRDDVRIVYPKKYNMPKKSDRGKHNRKRSRDEDVFEGLDEDEVKILKEIDDK
jgi:cell fate regulator YaaT (PSP1 superfamily)